jgi:aminotransferase
LTFDPARIEAAITPPPKPFCWASRINPTGAVASRERLLEIARIAEKYDLIVMSDEIYDRLVYAGHQHVCFATLPGMRARTILLGGFSKDYAMTGWRIGFACGAAGAGQRDGAHSPIHHYVRADHRSRGGDCGN